MSTSQTAIAAGRNGYRASGPEPAVAISARTNFDISDSLLAEVDFKWLMNGHGWHVDTTRFHEDAVYAEQVLALAMNSGSPALRDCAASFLAQIESAGE